MLSFLCCCLVLAISWLKAVCDIGVPMKSRKCLAEFGAAWYVFSATTPLFLRLLPTLA
jgi:hypothetical protein